MIHRPYIRGTSREYCTCTEREWDCREREERVGLWGERREGGTVGREERGWDCRERGEKVGLGGERREVGTVEEKGERVGF